MANQGYTSTNLWLESKRQNTMKISECIEKANQVIHHGEQNMGVHKPESINSKVSKEKQTYANAAIKNKTSVNSDFLKLNASKIHTE